MAGPTGIEPATLGLRVRCSSLTELRTRIVLKMVSLNDIELAVLLLQLDAGNANKKDVLLVFKVILRLILWEKFLF